MKSIIREFFTMAERDEIASDLPVTIFESCEADKAFRHFQKGTHIGKILVKIPYDTADTPIAQTLVPYTFSPDKTVLLVGGLGGIGRSIATWMVAYGTRSLIFLSPSAGVSESDKGFLRELEEQGCRTLAVRGSVAELETVESAISSSPTPIAGVVQLSMVLRVCLANHLKLVPRANSTTYVEKGSIP